MSMCVTGWPVPNDRTAPATARELIRDTLRSWGLHREADDIVLLASELVTNAVVHGRPPVHLRLQIDPDGRTLLCEVADADPRPPDPGPGGAFEEHGHGLVLVRALSSAQGWRATDSGKVVWFASALGARGRSPGRPF
ncbi:ATP-binding protein [Spirillospora sp. CA-294931]|uniref:ATP-binding protein n=1 Tax=Spirillospora sp. CA-294931 TaxID=3240042 RepID=UPI003D93BBD7